MEFVMRVDLGVVVGVLCALALFGSGYNRLVAEAERRGWAEGFVSLLVAVGTLGTLVGLAVVCWPAALLALGCFAASGTPMMVGSIWRYVRRRERERLALAREVGHGNDAEGVA